MKHSNNGYQSELPVGSCRRPKQARSWDARLASNLEQLLFGLAQQLLPAGITPTYFGDLAAYAFVRAAAKISKCRNGRVNGSRVAVLTALRRAEVKRLLAQGDDASQLRHMRQPRTEQVIHGWRTDRRYLNRNGHPRRLPIHGRFASFASLVKAFAGDVPPRAVLEELRRLEVVRQTGQYLELKGEERHRRTLVKSVRNILEVLQDGLEAVAMPSSPQAPNAPLHRISLSAADALDLEMMRARISSGAYAFMEGLKRSLDLPTSPPRRSKRMRHELTVTIVVNARRAERHMGMKP